METVAVVDCASSVSDGSSAETALDQQLLTQTDGWTEMREYHSCADEDVQDFRGTVLRSAQGHTVLQAVQQAAQSTVLRGVPSPVLQDPPGPSVRGCPGTVLQCSTDVVL